MFVAEWQYQILGAWLIDVAVVFQSFALFQL